MRLTYGIEKSGKILNTIDEKGISIFHLILALDYHEVIGVF